MANTFHVTKRKLAKAVKVAIEDGKISPKPFELYVWYGEVILFWPDRKVSATVRTRDDLTIFVSYEQSHENTIGFVHFVPSK